MKEFAQKVGADLVNQMMATSVKIPLGLGSIN